MNRSFLGLFLLLLAASVAHGQSYNTAAGIRVERGLDLTLQQRIAGNWTAEAMVHTSFFSKDLGLSLLAERHHKIFIRNFNFYYGVGGHYYAESDANRRNVPELVQNVWGLSGIGGVEVSLGRLNLAVDAKPELHFGGDQTYPLEWRGVALSARYIFDKRERRTLRDRWNHKRDDWRDRRNRDDRRGGRNRRWD
jgi:hypothetical protein